MMESGVVTDDKPVMVDRGISKQNRRIILVLAVSILLSVFYLGFSWSRYRGIAESEAIILANSLNSMLHPEHVMALSGGPEDLDKADYTLTRTGLTRLLKKQPIKYDLLIFWACRKTKLSFLLTLSRLILRIIRRRGKFFMKQAKKFSYLFVPAKLF